MNQQGFIYLIPFLISASISTGVGIYAWQRREVNGATPFALSAFAQASWTLGFVFELASPGLTAKIFWDNTQFIGYLVAPMAMLAFALDYTGRKLAHPKFTWITLISASAIAIVLVFTDPMHGLIRPDARLVPGVPFSALVYEFTAIFLLITGFAYAITLWGIAILLGVLVRPRSLYRGQIATILIGALIPLLGGILSLTGNAPSFHRDISPFTFALNNLIVAFGLFRFRLFDIVPVARDRVIESIEDTVIVIDPKNRIVDLNPAGLRALDRPASEVIGKPVEQVYASWPELLTRYLNLQEAHSEISVPSKDGALHFDLRLSSLKDRGGRITGRVMVVRDITEQKRTQEVVGIRTRELEIANSRLTIANEHLQVLGRAKDEFVSNVSHELRTPITNLNLYLDLLKRRPEKTSIYMQTLDREIKRLEHMIEGLLTLSRFDQDRAILSNENLSLNGLCKVYVDDRASLAESKGVSLQFDAVSSLPGVNADANLIGQVISILLTNAINYTPNGGEILVSTVRRDAEEQIWSGFCVSDTGPGIAADERDHLFTRFYRGRAGRTSHVPGTGLGLAIVKEIVDRHCGLVEVESSGVPGEGATFRVWLPAAGEENLL